MINNESNKPSENPNALLLLARWSGPGYKWRKIAWLYQLFIWNKQKKELFPKSTEILNAD